MSRPVALVGLPAVGKSTVAAALAERLGTTSIDLDAAISDRAGCSVADLFERDGEAAFRALETTELRSVLEAGGAGVISCGGGVVGSSENRELLGSRTRCVWLSAPVPVLVGRARSEAGTRPLLVGDVEARLNDLATTREPLYRSVAEIEVAVDGLSPAEVVDRIVEQLGGGT